MSVEKPNPEKKPNEPLKLTLPEDPDWIDMLHDKVLQYQITTRKNVDSRTTRKRKFALQFLEDLLTNTTITIPRSLDHSEYQGFKIVEKFITDKERLTKSINKFEAKHPPVL